MSSIFDGCSSLLSLPDISKWNINNVTNIDRIFYRCSSLISLPDISKWNTDKIVYKTDLFNGCLSLPYLPDILKWKFSSDPTKGCFSLLNKAQ